MKNNLLKMQALEEAKIHEEIKKAGNAFENYKMIDFYKSLALYVFITNAVVIIMSVVYQFLLIKINNLLINIVIIMLSIFSLSLLLVSNFYENKTLKILSDYYEK